MRRLREVGVAASRRRHHRIDRRRRQFLLYGTTHATLPTDAGYRPAVGDAVVYDYGGNGYVDHVGIVTAANADGSLETANGDSGGQSGSEAQFSSTSTVQHQSLAVGQTAVGSTPSSTGMTISGYITLHPPTP